MSTPTRPAGPSLTALRPDLTSTTRYSSQPRPRTLGSHSSLANERTFLDWMNMAITLGGVSALLTVFSCTDTTIPAEESQLISARTINIVTCIYLPLSMGIMCYALATYYWRRSYLQRQQARFFDDKVGPVAVAVLVMLTLGAVTVIAFLDFFF